MAKKSHKTSTPARSKQLRIISGIWRSRIIEFDPVSGLRPTGDRIRETLFNWLAPHIPGARCLDLFSGSGALGFEAISRGASHCTLVDSNSTVTKKLNEQISLLQATNIVVEQRDVLEFLSTSPAKPFDTVFIDPPFALELLTPTCNLLKNNQWLSADAFIYCEQSVTDSSFTAPANWQLIRTKTSGDVRYSLYTH